MFRVEVHERNKVVSADVAVNMVRDGVDIWEWRASSAAAPPTSSAWPWSSATWRRAAPRT
ncbi:MAG: hypothetical protein MZV70_41150 [Desulfobacterales bacterium]|nr:hypothetical protein [Desulfobacterales bacterium]